MTVTSLPFPTPRDAARTRQRILAAARTSFARYGYAGSTVRAIATDAGVSPNLITRYFGGKPGLFAEATAVELNASATYPGPWSQLGRRIAHAVVRRWEGANAEDPMLMMIRSAGGSDEAARIFSRSLDEQTSTPLQRYLIDERGLDADEALNHAVAVVSFILGVVTARHVVRLKPLASTDVATLEEWLGERLQRLLETSPPESVSAT